MLIRNKLILRFTGLTLLIQVALSAAVYWLAAVAREQRFTDRLAGEAALAARLLVRDHQLAAEYVQKFHPREVPNLVGEEISLFDAASGKLLFFSAAAGGRESPADHRRMFSAFRSAGSRATLRFPHDSRETVALPYLDRQTGRRYVLLAGGYDDDGRRALRRLGRSLLVGNVAALALLILAAWYFADEALRPIAGMVARVRRITAEHLSARLDEGNRTDELAQLAITFNQMLAGLEDAFERQRAFVSHASHELRTPLTVLRGTLETAVTYDRTLPDAHASMQQAIAELQKLIDLTNGLLTLAQADARPDLRGAAPVRLDECLLEALADAHRRHPTLSVSLTLAEPPPTLPPDAEPYAVSGHTSLLTTALVNLLDNAGKYGAPPVAVELAYATPTLLRLRVRDHGPGLPPAELARAFEPLFRGEATRAHRPGFGLGLPVVKRVAELHGGSITLASAPDGGGMLAELLLPALV